MPISDREKLALDRIWKAMGCAWNPDACKQSVRDTMWTQVVEFSEQQTAGKNRLRRENDELRAVLAAPVAIDKAKLAEVLGDHYPGLDQTACYDGGCNL